MRSARRDRLEGVAGPASAPKPEADGGELPKAERSAGEDSCCWSCGAPLDVLGMSMGVLAPPDPPLDSEWRPFRAYERFETRLRFNMSLKRRGAAAAAAPPLEEAEPEAPLPEGPSGEELDSSLRLETRVDASGNMWAKAEEPVTVQERPEVPAGGPPPALAAMPAGWD